MKIIEFFTKDIWRSGVGNFKFLNYKTIRQIKIIIIAFRGFRSNRCYLRASALTYYTVLSLVPILALVFGISKGFGLDERLEKLIYERFHGHDAVIHKLVTFSDNLLNRTNGGLIAGVGVIILIWSVIRLLCNAEHSLNAIWGIKKQRTIFRQLTDYLSTILVCPILLIVSGSFTTHIASVISSFHYIPSRVDIIVSSLTPYVMIWLVFAFIYKFIPNCKVMHRASLYPGIIAGTVFCFIQWIYVNFQIGVTRYNAIYGSFAALPLFLIWVQISWLVVLFGAEISYAYQNIEDFEYEENISNISNNMKMLLSLRIVQIVVKAFCQDNKPFMAHDISKIVQIPIRLTRELIYELTQANILSEVMIADNEKETFYNPAHDPEKMTIFYVINALNMNRHHEIYITNSEEFEIFDKSLKEFNNLIINSPANKLLKNI